MVVVVVVVITSPPLSLSSPHPHPLITTILFFSPPFPPPFPPSFLLPSLPPPSLLFLLPQGFNYASGGGAGGASSGAAGLGTATPVENNPRRAFQMALDGVWEELTGAGGGGHNRLPPLTLPLTPSSTPP